MQAMNQAIDEVRAEEARRLKRDGYEPVLKPARWCLRKWVENRTRKQTVKLAELLKYNLRTVRAYRMREDFQRFWTYQYPGWARRCLRGMKGATCPCRGSTPSRPSDGAFSSPSSSDLEYEPAMPNGYRCEATSVRGFIQQLAVGYVSRGYWFYVTGQVPERKDPRAVDEKLIRRYGVGELSPWAMSRRKGQGYSSVQYLRHRRFFVLLAAHGTHRFFEDEAKVIQDVRVRPLVVFGYSIRHAGGHALVSIAEHQFEGLKREFADLALWAPVERLSEELRSLPYEPYRPVWNQYRRLLRIVNRKRRVAGLELVHAACLPSERRVYRPFERAEGTEQVAA
jgi:hypothetical protein